MYWFTAVMAVLGGALLILIADSKRLFSPTPLFQNDLFASVPAEILVPLGLVCTVGLGGLLVTSEQNFLFKAHNPNKG